MGWLQGADEAARLSEIQRRVQILANTVQLDKKKCVIPKYSLIVCVRREGNVVDLHLERQLLAAHRCDLLGFREDHLSEGALDTVAGHNAAVLGVRAPVLEELP